MKTFIPHLGTPSPHLYLIFQKTMNKFEYRNLVLFNNGFLNHVAGSTKGEISLMNPE
jgi:hypothetical protein